VYFTGSGDVDSWEDIAADEQQPKQRDASSNTLPSTTPPQSATTITTSEAPDNMDTTTQPSSSSPASQSATKETPSSGDSSASHQPNETEMGATGISKVGSDSHLIPKDHSSPSVTPVPSKLKTVAAPQKSENDKENVNIVFIGHVDAGKSTIGGHVMLVCMCVCVYVCVYGTTSLKIKGFWQCLDVSVERVRSLKHCLMLLVSGSWLAHIVLSLSHFMM